MGSHRLVAMTGPAMEPSTMPPFAILLAVQALAGSTPASLPTLVASAGYQRNIAHLFSTLPPQVFQRCGSLVSTGSQVTVIEPATFAPDGHPTAGLWKQGFPVSGCGNDTAINFFFRGQPDGRIDAIMGTPGETTADLTLQRDASIYVTTAILARRPGCGAVIVTDSRLVDRFAQGPRHGWREEWTASACGQAVRVPLTFLSDATGTTVTAGPPVPVG